MAAVVKVATIRQDNALLKLRARESLDIFHHLHDALFNAEIVGWEDEIRCFRRFVRRVDSCKVR